MKIQKFPQLIDIHVHLRDPGQTHKEDFFTGTQASLAGGITTVFDMPNNAAAIFTKELLNEKQNIAETKAVCDYGFYFGTDGKNIEEFKKVKDEVVGLKIYLNLTTGKTLIEDESVVETIFSNWPKEKVIIVHAEGKKVDFAIALTKKYGNKLHITHVPDKETLEKIVSAKKEGLNLSCDVTPHHLFLSEEDTDKLGSFAAVKPTLKSKKDQEFLWENLQHIDCVATDHAPHVIEEKQSSTPPSGFPGLETMLPLLLTAVSDGKLKNEDIIRLLHTGPIKIFNLKGEGSTYTEVDLDEKWIVKGENLKSKSRWTPFEGWTVKGRVKKVVIREEIVFEDGKICVDQGFGKNVL